MRESDSPAPPQSLSVWRVLIAVMALVSIAALSQELAWIHGRSVKTSNAGSVSQTPNAWQSHTSSSTPRSSVASTWSRSSNQLHKSTQQQQHIVPASTTSSVLRVAKQGKSAVVSIAIGPKARWFARFLITENATYYDDLQGEYDAHQRSRIRFIDVDLSKGAGTVGGLELPVIPDDLIIRENAFHQIVWVQFSQYKRNRLQIKWLKSKVFELVPPEYEYLVFMDSDIFIGQPLQPFVDTATTAFLANNSIIALFRDIGHTGSPYHTGVVVLSRTMSPPLVELWGANIMLGTFGSDQRAIEAAINSLEGREKVSFMPVEREHGFFTFVDGKLFNSKLTPTFIHATFYRMTTGKLFGFTNRTAKYYFEKRINTPFEPWSGKDDAPLYARYCDNLRGWPNVRPPKKKGKGNDEDDDVSESQIERELAEGAKVEVGIVEGDE